MATTQGSAGYHSGPPRTRTLNAPVSHLAAARDLTFVQQLQEEGGAEENRADKNAALALEAQRAHCRPLYYSVESGHLDRRQDAQLKSVLGGRRRFGLWTIFL